MIELAKNIVIVSTGLVALIAAIYSVLKFWGSLKPLRIEPCMHFNLESNNDDSIGAKVINRSKEPVYIIACHAKEAKKISRAVVTHLKNPFIKPSLYSCVWYGAKQYDLLHNKQIKLDPGDSIELRHALDLKSPMAGFMEPEFLIVAKLSSGRIVKSYRMQTPEAWHYNFIRRDA